LLYLALRVHISELHIIAPSARSLKYTAFSVVNAFEM